MTIAFIVIGSVIAIIFLYLIIKFLTKPKIKYTKNNTNIKNNTEKKEEKQAEVKSVEGLVFEEKFVYPEEPVRNNFNSGLRKIQKPLSRQIFRKEKKKSLAEQINELSPELKALLLDKGLARKDNDLNSK